MDTREANGGSIDVTARKGTLKTDKRVTSPSKRRMGARGAGLLVVSLSMLVAGGADAIAPEAPGLDGRAIQAASNDVGDVRNSLTSIDISTPETNNCPCNPDVDKDGSVTPNDDQLLKQCFGQPPTGTCQNADVNCDGAIDQLDQDTWRCLLDNPPDVCCPKEDFCIYRVDCIDGPCLTCPLHKPGDLCVGAACPGGTCAGGFSSTCGGTGCCVEFSLVDCRPPAGEPPCPIEDVCTCDPTPGACCDEANVCEVVPESKCMGQYLGDGTACQGDADGDMMDDACEFGACCDNALPGGQCIGEMLEKDCFAAGVAEQPKHFKGLTCADVVAQGLCQEHEGACCDNTRPDPQCIGVLPESVCLDTAVQPKWFKDATCAEVEDICREHEGACCDNTLPDPQCLGVMTESACLNIAVQPKWFKDASCPDVEPLCREHTGACCDHARPGGACIGPITESACMWGPDGVPGTADDPEQPEFFKDQTCADVEAAGLCEEHTGACCDHASPGGTCTGGLTESQCLAFPELQPEFFKDQSCADVEANGLCEEHTGACCDHAQPGGVCIGPVTETRCFNGPDGVAGTADDPEQPKFFKGQSCAAVESAGLCEEHTGACCDHATGNCLGVMTQSQCLSVAEQPEFFKGITCSSPDFVCPRHMGACCDNVDGSCTQTFPENCQGPKLKWFKDTPCSPDLCGQLYVKWSQRPTGDGEDVASEIDWLDMAPDVVVSDDFVSDGRPITAVRWWGSVLKVPDPKACTGKGTTCGPAGSNCICETRFGTNVTNCADANDLATAVHGFCPNGDSQCPTGTKCFGQPGETPVCAHNCGDHPPDPKLCDGKGTDCGDGTMQCVCETREDGTLNCADAADYFSNPPIHGFCDLGVDPPCPTGTKCFINRTDGPVCAHNCGDHPTDPKVCEGKGTTCGPAGSECVCETRFDGTLNCADAGDFFDPTRHGTCPNGDAECPTGTKCFVNTPPGTDPVCAHNCEEHPPDPKECSPKGATCGDPLLDCVCANRIDGSLNCADSADLAGSTISCTSDADCAAAGLATAKCFGQQGTVGVCAHNCGEVPPAKVCDQPGDSPFCVAAFTPCDDPALECHCGRRSPDGVTLNGGSACLKSNQFSDCAALAPCANIGDLDCEAALPGSKCVFDECCGFVCALNCRDVPPDPKACPNPWICGQNPGDFPCGSDPNCLCTTDPAGDGVCIDLSQATCNFPCPNGNTDCPAGTKCDGGQSCCGQPVCVANCPTVPALTAPRDLPRAAMEYAGVEVDVKRARQSSSRGTGRGTVAATGSRDDLRSIPVGGEAQIARPAARTVPEQQVFEPDGWFISFHPKLEKNAPQAEALGLYFCDFDVVRKSQTPLPACDGHPVIEYLVNLSDCCLVHANTDPRSALPFIPATTDAFLEEKCFDYSLDIQAVVGARFAQDPVTLECIKQPTNRTADSDFWGWHTTAVMCGKLSPAAPHEALTGRVEMGAGGEWLYGPWANVPTTCSPANMAFELLTPDPAATPPDANGNCVPDQCECTPSSQPQLATLRKPQGKVPFSTNRFLPVKLTDTDGTPRLIRVEAIKLPDPFGGWNGQVWWVGQPYQICEKANEIGPPCSPVPGQPKKRHHNWYADLVCDQALAEPITVGQCVAGVCVGGFAAGEPCNQDDHCKVLYLQHEGVVPSTGCQDAVYEVRAIATDCSKADPNNFSPPLSVTQSRFGDVAGVGSQCEDPAPNGNPGIEDINVMLRKFSNANCQAKKARTDLRGSTGQVDFRVDLFDVNSVLAGFSNPCVLPWNPTDPTDRCKKGLATEGKTAGE